MGMVVGILSLVLLSASFCLGATASLYVVCKLLRHPSLFLRYSHELNSALVALVVCLVLVPVRAAQYTLQILGLPTPPTLCTLGLSLSRGLELNLMLTLAALAIKRSRKIRSMSHGSFRSKAEVAVIATWWLLGIGIGLFYVTWAATCPAPGFWAVGVGRSAHEGPHHDSAEGGNTNKSSGAEGAVWVGKDGGSGEGTEDKGGWVGGECYPRGEEGAMRTVLLVLHGGRLLVLVVTSMVMISTWISVLKFFNRPAVGPLVGRYQPSADGGQVILEFPNSMTSFTDSHIISESGSFMDDRKQSQFRRITGLPVIEELEHSFSDIVSINADNGADHTCARLSRCSGEGLHPRSRSSFDNLAMMQGALSEFRVPLDCRTMKSSISSVTTISIFSRQLHRNVSTATSWGSQLSGCSGRMNLPRQSFLTPGRMHSTSSRSSCSLGGDLSLSSSTLPPFGHSSSLNSSTPLPSSHDLSLTSMGGLPQGQNCDCSVNSCASIAAQADCSCPASMPTVGRSAWPSASGAVTGMLGDPSVFSSRLHPGPSEETCSTHNLQRPALSERLPCSHRTVPPERKRDTEEERGREKTGEVKGRNDKEKVAEMFAKTEKLQREPSTNVFSGAGEGRPENRRRCRDVEKDLRTETAAAMPSPHSKNEEAKHLSCHVTSGNSRQLIDVTTSPSSRHMMTSSRGVTSETACRGALAPTSSLMPEKGSLLLTSEASLMSDTPPVSTDLPSVPAKSHAHSPCDRTHSPSPNPDRGQDALFMGMDNLTKYMMNYNAHSLTPAEKVKMWDARNSALEDDDDDVFLSDSDECEDVFRAGCDLRNPGTSAEGKKLRKEEISSEICESIRGAVCGSSSSVRLAGMPTTRYSPERYLPIKNQRGSETLQRRCENLSRGCGNVEDPGREFSNLSPELVQSRAAQSTQTCSPHLLQVHGKMPGMESCSSFASYGHWLFDDGGDPPRSPSKGSSHSLLREVHETIYEEDDHPSPQGGAEETGAGFFSCPQNEIRDPDERKSSVRYVTTAETTGSLSPDSDVLIEDVLLDRLRRYSLVNSRSSRCSSEQRKLIKSYDQDQGGDAFSPAVTSKSTGQQTPPGGAEGHKKPATSPLASLLDATADISSRMVADLLRQQGLDNASGGGDDFGVAEKMSEESLRHNKHHVLPPLTRAHSGEDFYSRPKLHLPHLRAGSCRSLFQRLDSLEPPSLQPLDPLPSRLVGSMSCLPSDLEFFKEERQEIEKVWKQFDMDIDSLRRQGSANGAAEKTHSLETSQIDGGHGCLEENKRQENLIDQKQQQQQQQLPQHHHHQQEHQQQQQQQQQQTQQQQQMQQQQQQLCLTCNKIRSDSISMAGSSPRAGSKTSNTADYMFTNMADCLLPPRPTTLELGMWPRADDCRGDGTSGRAGHRDTLTERLGVWEEEEEENATTASLRDHPVSIRIIRPSVQAQWSVKRRVAVSTAPPCPLLETEDEGVGDRSSPCTCARPSQVKSTPRSSHMSQRSFPSNRESFFSGHSSLRASSSVGRSSVYTVRSALMEMLDWDTLETISSMALPEDAVEELYCDPPTDDHPLPCPLHEFPVQDQQVPGSVPIKIAGNDATSSYLGSCSQTSSDTHFRRHLSQNPLVHPAFVLNNPRTRSKVLGCLMLGIVQYLMLLLPDFVLKSLTTTLASATYVEFSPLTESLIVVLSVLNIYVYILRNKTIMTLLTNSNFPFA